MKVLFIGGTGMISAAAGRRLVAAGIDLSLLHRGAPHGHPDALSGGRHLTADIHHVEPPVPQGGADGVRVVVDWIAYTPADIERDLALFRGRVARYVFISSAAAYQKPPATYLITESTPLRNPYWAYARHKIACEMRLLQAYRDDGFPVTIARPSLTYDPNFPIAIGGCGSAIPTTLIALPAIPDRLLSFPGDDPR